MQVGQKVVCVDDYFPGPLAKYYAQLPVKGRTYTIRAVYLGRAIMHTKSGAADGELGVLVKELVNGPDPRNVHGQELGFKSDRFRPLEDTDTTTENEQEDELVSAGTAPYAPSTSQEEFNTQLAAMAADPEIQQEIKQIETEFRVTENDGLERT